MEILQKNVCRIDMVHLADTYDFAHECRSDGILVTVNSEVPYTGALYGLYDYFSCRVYIFVDTISNYLFGHKLFKVIKSNEINS